MRISCAKSDGSGVSRAIEPQLAAVDPAEHGAQPFEVHRLLEAVAHGLRHERMIGDLPIAGDVLEAGGRVGEHGRHQVVGQHPLDLGATLRPPRARGTASEMVVFHRHRVLNTGASRNAWTSTSRVVSGCR